MNMQLYYLVLPKTPMNIRISRLWSTKNEQNFSHGKSFKIPLNKNHQAERLRFSHRASKRQKDCQLVTSSQRKILVPILMKKKLKE